MHAPKTMSYNPRQFVDREPELAAFKACLQSTEERPVLLFHGQLGAGKSSILRHLHALCGQTRTTCVLLDFQHDPLDTPEEIIRLLSKRIGGAFAEAIERERKEIDSERKARQQARLAEYLKSLAPVSGLQAPLLAAQPASSDDIRGTIGDQGPGSQAAIGKNIVQYQVVNKVYLEPETTPAEAQKERVRRLSEKLWELLTGLAAREPVVLLFDSCDMATSEAIVWLRTELLSRLLEASPPAPGNLATVIVGDPRCKKAVWLDTMAGWGERVDAHKLDNLPPEAVREYWVKIRGLDEGRLRAIFGTAGVLPDLLVGMADRFAGGPGQ